MAQIGKKSSPFLFKINCPWKARSDYVSLGLSRDRSPRLLLYPSLAMHQKMHSVCQHMQAELWDRHPTILLLALHWSPFDTNISFSSCMGLRQLVIEASVGDLVSPAGGKLKSMLHCSMLSCKKADFRVYVKLILAHPNLEVSMFSFYSTIKMLIYVCKCIHKFCCSSYVLF